MCRICNKYNTKTSEIPVEDLYGKKLGFVYHVFTDRIDEIKYLLGERDYYIYPGGYRKVLTEGQEAFIVEEGDGTIVLDVDMEFGFKLINIGTYSYVVVKDNSNQCYVYKIM